jgi:hypothetical protein
MNRAPAHELSRTGVGLIGGTRFVPLDNGFPTVEDVAAVQGICDGLDEGPITEGLSHLPELKEIGFTASRRRPPAAAHPWPHPPHPARLPLPVTAVGIRQALFPTRLTQRFLIPSLAELTTPACQSRPVAGTRPRLRSLPGRPRPPGRTGCLPLPPTETTAIVRFDSPKP